MDINLRKLISNPIIIAVLVVVLSMTSFFVVKEQGFVKQIAVKNYLQSESFMRELAKITNELSKYGQEDMHKGIPTDSSNPSCEEDEENLKRKEIFKWLQYYITTKEHYYHNDVMEKFLGNGIGFYNQTQAMIDESVFYLQITCKDGGLIQIDSSVYIDKYLSDYIKQLNLLMEQDKKQYGKSVDEFEIYFFVPKGISINEELVIQGQKQVNLFVFLLIQTISIIIYGVSLFIINSFIKKEEWHKETRIPFKARVIGYIWMVFVIRWLLIKASEQGVTWGIIIERESGILFCAIVMIAFLSSLGYELNCLMCKVQYTFNEKNIVPPLEYIHSKGKRLYEYLGIDLNYKCWVKLAKLNMIHLVVVGVMVLVARHDGASSVVLMAIWCMMLGILIKSLLRDWSQFVQQLGKNTLIQYTDEINRLEKYGSYIWEVFFGYCVALFVVVGLTTVSTTGYIGVILFIGCIYFVSWKTVGMVWEIYDYADQILEHNKQAAQKVGFFKPIIEALEHAEESFNKAVQREVASERMKTELISNVSHDLKTPLTAIISYIDLLKREDLSPEEQKKYIEILDQKSQRLKILIEDLFEASKAASGNIQFTLEEINLVALLKQTLGEMSEKVGRSHLQFKVTVPEKKLMSYLDGRRTYRIFENLINNILKYAAPYSRVYIECKEEGESVIVIFKNISEKEMNFTAEEIVERFKRGDASRHTEGSGLGLAIAKNLTELQGGVFEVYIDGDLFKVSVKFPKVKEQEKSQNIPINKNQEEYDEYDLEESQKEETQGIGKIIKKHIKYAIEEIQNEQGGQKEQDEEVDLNDYFGKDIDEK